MKTCKTWHRQRKPHKRGQLGGRGKEDEAAAEDHPMMYEPNLKLQLCTILCATWEVCLNSTTEALTKDHGAAIFCPEHSRAPHPSAELVRKSKTTEFSRLPTSDATASLGTCYRCRAFQVKQPSRRLIKQ